MHPPCGPIDVVRHWPYVRRNLNLSRARPTARALDLLAELQWDAGGEPVPLGRQRLVATGLTAGEAGAAWNALVAAEGGRVVVRYRGAGRRADAWSFRADVEHWRAVPWTLSARDVAKAVRGCVCSTFCAVAARNPGQGVDPRRQFWLSADDHLRPPGLFLVDSRGNGAKSGATAQRPGSLPVDSRGYSARSGPPSFPLEEQIVLREDDERVERLLQGIEAATRGQQRGPNGRAVWGVQLRRLHALAAGLDVDQAGEVGRQLAAATGSYAVRLVTTAEELAQQVRRQWHPAAAGPTPVDLSPWGVNEA